MDDDESSDAFDPAPVPTKRRRLSGPSGASGNNTSRSATPVNQPKKRGRPRKEPPQDFSHDPKVKKLGKGKHRIHIIDDSKKVRDVYATQVDQVPSSPYRIRGAIWRKQAAPNFQAAAVDDVAEKNKSQGSIAAGIASSPPLTQHAKGTGVGRRTNGTGNTARDSESSSEDDGYEDAFEPLIPRTVQHNAPLSEKKQGNETLDTAKQISDHALGGSSEDDFFEPLQTTEVVRRDSKTIASGKPALSAKDDSFVTVRRSSAQEQVALNDSVHFQPPTQKHLQVDNPTGPRRVSQPKAPLPQSKEDDLAQDVDDLDFETALADLPDDAFDSSPMETRVPKHVVSISSQSSPVPRPNLAAPQSGLRQMTLFGMPALQTTHASQNNKRHNWPLAQKNEAPTHHKLNQEALKTWVYPTNLGTSRDYQYTIVRNGLYNNLLVALPTGLGKTFIAATIMLNWFRWTKDAQIVFVAPTKPLVSQQVEACFGIAGIPRSQTSMLTGGIPPGLRAQEWETKRVFFMTPQTIVNDLKTGTCDPKRIVLLVVDEAHRATGAYAYVEVVKFIRRFNQSFRVLALTATPGASVEAVQEVIDGLDISRVEIRTEFSLDIQQYVYTRRTDREVFEITEEMQMIMDWFSKAVQPVLNQLIGFNAYWSRDPLALTAYGLTQARAKWFQQAGRNATAPQKAMVHRLVSVLASLAHSVELLKFHGMGPFYHGMLSFQSRAAGSKDGGGKYEKQILDNENFRKMMTRLRFWMNNDTFIGHPKLEYLQKLVINHFLDAGEHSNTRVMIFAHYRDSADEIVRVLNRNKETVKAHVFVGQAASKGSEGMDQKKQLEIIQSFKDGTYNTLVATSIGEEGLDIGEIDLIICYDSSASPVRMLQRMGRTGRKRAGRIILLLMKGKEEDSFAKAKDNYAKMQSMISSGQRFRFHDDRSPRIVPREIEPEVDKRVVEIPVENKEATLPEPKKNGKVPKRPAKKFHMPDGVTTGFVSAANMDGKPAPRSAPRQKKVLPGEELVEVPTLEDIALTLAEERELERYQRIEDPGDGDIVITRPALDLHPQHQRTLGPTRLVQHGRETTRTVNMLSAMNKMTDSQVEQWKQLSHSINFDSLYAGQIGAAPDDVSSAPGASSEEEDENEEEEEAPLPARPPATRKPMARPRSKPSNAKSSRKPTATQTAMEDGSSSPPATSPRLGLPSQGISLGSGDTDGEDIDEDPSSELRDFIADDNEDVDVDIGLTSSLSLPERGGRRLHQRVRAGPVERDEGSQSESELEGLSQILRGGTARTEQKRDSGVAGLAALVEEDDEDASGVGRVQQRKRRVVVDSSD